MRALPSMLGFQLTTGEKHTLANNLFHLASSSMPSKRSTSAHPSPSLAVHHPFARYDALNDRQHHQLHAGIYLHRLVPALQAMASPPLPGATCGDRQPEQGVPSEFLGSFPSKPPATPYFAAEQEEKNSGDEDRQTYASWLVQSQAIGKETKNIHEKTAQVCQIWVQFISSVYNSFLFFSPPPAVWESAWKWGTWNLGIHSR